MHSGDWRLINGEFVEAIPAALARARGNATARALSGADWLIRRKSDGRFLALRSGETIAELQRGALSRELRGDLLALVDADAAGETARPLTGLLGRLHALGLNEIEYSEASGLPLVPEPGVLSYAGRDRYLRPLWLTQAATRAWRHMRAKALSDGVTLEAISGYRSHDYQLGIFKRKLARGQTIEEILVVNAAPGYSEHHSGNAMDIGAPGDPPAEESFERTDAFAWLTENAGDFGFVMSYPRDNTHGIVYEPWHWCWQEVG